MPSGISIYRKFCPQNLSQIWRQLEDKGLRPRLKGYQPHITLGGAVDAVADDFTAELASLVESEPVHQIAITSLDTFDIPEGIVLFFKGTVLTELIEFHSRFDLLLQKFAQNLGPLDVYYHPGNWTPHCTLTWGLSPNQLSEAKQICQSLALPRVGNLVSTAIVEMRSRTKVLETFFSNRRKESESTTEIT